MSEPVSRIALFGQARELWPVAAYLARQLPERIELLLVEDGTPPPGPVAHSLPLASPFHAELGFSAESVVQRGGMLGLGSDYLDWKGGGSRLFSAASGSLPTIDGVALHHVLRRAAQTYETPDRLAHLYEPLRFCARAAMEGRFSLPAEHPNSPMAMLGPTLQCDADIYARMCRDTLEEGAFEPIDGVPVAIEGQAARIETVRLAGGRQISADFHVDLSGTLSALVPVDARPSRRNPAMAAPFDRILRARRSEATEAWHTIARALPGGVLVDTPLGEGGIAALPYASAHMDDAAATKAIGCEGEPAPFEGFACDAPWTGNLARLGPASARLGPHLSADMLLLQTQALHLSAALPADRQMGVEADLFNRRHAQTVAQIDDFGCLPFRLNARDGSFWQQARQADCSPTLALRLDQFASRGRLVTFDRELFDPQTWIETLIGFGIVPARHDRRADGFDMAALAPRLQALVRDFDRALADMPGHAQFVAGLGES